MPNPNPNLRVEPSQEADMIRCAEILSLSFAHESIGPLLFGSPHDPSSWARTALAHWTAVLEHAASFPSVPFAVKCVHTDPESGAETIIGTAYWAVYDRERTPEEAVVEPYTNRLEYVEPAAARESARQIMAPAFAMKHRLVGGQRYGFLSYMAVDPAWRRRGAATACVRWGMERCEELGVPAYLEATEQGRKAYLSMGWEVVRVEGEEMEFPPMMWWPEGVERWVEME